MMRDLVNPSSLGRRPSARCRSVPEVELGPTTANLERLALADDERCALHGKGWAGRAPNGAERSAAAERVGLVSKEDGRAGGCSR